jgi:hypothetical protein
MQLRFAHTLRAKTTSQAAAQSFMFEAQRQWVFRLGSFAEHFRYQYVISRQVEEIEGFQHLDCGDWHLHTGASLPVTVLTDIKDREIGAVIGIAVGPEALLGPRKAQLPVNSFSKNFWNDIEKYLTDVAGRYAFVLTSRGQTRLYTDPVGMIGAVYNAEDGFIASSPLLAIKRPVIPNPAFDLEMIETGGGRLSLFHTLDAHVRRLNPNHYLDFKTFEETRFWPRDEAFDTPPDTPVSIYSEIISRAQFNIGAIAEAYPCSLPISGGQDSRLLLGFCGPHLKKIQQFYTHINNYATRRDAAIGSELCRAVGVDHDIHDKRDFALTRKEVRLSTRAYQIGYGAPVSPPKEYLNGVIQGVPDGNVILRGHQTDILRAVFVFQPKEKWHEPDWQIERLLIVPRDQFDTAVADRFRDDFRTWQDTLPASAKHKAADFMFLEVYYNSTVGASFAAAWKNFYVAPFNSRRLISLALQFDETDRRASRPVFELIELMDENLSKVPFDFEWKVALDQIGDPAVHEEQTRVRRRRTNKSLATYANRQVAE